ncbi:hypothetical protein TNCT_52551 [Trichonephila clavata]|uniref:Uncharacterized protein n=1 Tax=Trichonephila clavata TaxID=2740835 RepID=A0A8X6FDG9_TRICU|nr:hypothetical protein TNCT_52551 [Trichonephila clavata]
MSLGAMMGSNSRSGQSRKNEVLLEAKGHIICLHNKKQNACTLVASILIYAGVTSSFITDHEFAHFSNASSIATGGLFKARQRGDTHTMLPERSKADAKEDFFI